MGRWAEDTEITMPCASLTINPQATLGHGDPMDRVPNCREPLEKYFCRLRVIFFLVFLNDDSYICQSQGFNRLFYACLRDNASVF